jgi:hypothetical protein
MKTAFFHIRDGQIVNQRTVRKAFELPDGGYELKIVKKNRRSLSQNAYYWSAVVHDLTLEETHDFLKGRFNAKEIINTDTGEVISVPRSTTELNKTQFGEYIEKIQQFSIEYLGVNIPSPNEQVKIFN